MCANPFAKAKKACAIQTALNYQNPARLNQGLKAWTGKP